MNGNGDPADQLVTLTSTEKLIQADILLGRLKASGIDAFIPDEFLMQANGFNLNAFGYVRVQVRRKDFERAEELLSARDESE